MKVREWRGIRDLIAAELKTDEKAGEMTYGEPFAVALSLYTHLTLPTKA